MTKRSALRWLLIAATSLGAAVASHAQEERKLTTIYFGVKACVACHGKESDAFANRAKLAHADNVFTSRLLESNIWSQHDKHKDAARVLKNERSKQIAAIMKLPADLTNEPRCANCHGVYIDPAREKELIHEDTFQGDDRLASGVSCVACHGPIAEWVNEHAAPLPKKKWATRSRDEKAQEFGLRDLWDPVERAQVCFSCHIGNIKEGKFVSHEMYAAGHPPLPSIELTAFSEAMPAHWESLTQKAARALEGGEKARNGAAFLKAAYGMDAKAMRMEQTRLVALTSLVALRDSVRMMGEFAAESLKPKALDATWPELAFFDCYACHHDLKTKSWRLERGYQGKPGRPTVRPWSYPLALAADRLIDPPTLDPALKSWNAVFQNVPFGDPRSVVAQAKALDLVLAKRIQALAAKPIDRAVAERFALDIAEAAAKDVHDFDSARQFAWALRTIATELQDGGRYVLMKPGEHRLKGEIGEQFRTLEKTLQLTLPEGQVEIAPSSLDRVLGQISAYDPAEFRATMRAIAKTLSR
ncbi:MAG: multiheme c-type cytochrome [Planctomycetota bacterium]